MNAKQCKALRRGIREYAQIKTLRTTREHYELQQRKKVNVELPDGRTGVVTVNQIRLVAACPRAVYRKAKAVLRNAQGNNRVGIRH